MLNYIRDLSPDGAIIDVSANIGNHTVFLAALTTCSEVIAIEPQPLVFKNLTHNIKYNSLQDKVKLVNAAAGSKNGRCGLKWEALDKLGGTQVVDGDTTDMKRLDDIAGKKKISVIKIDVEGYELDALQGAKQILKQQSPHLFIEIWDRASKKSIDNYLNPMGYFPVRVFNSSATYYYKKGHKFSRDLEGLMQRSLYYASRLRLLRQTS